MIVVVHLHEYSLPHGTGNARICRCGRALLVLVSRRVLLRVLHKLVSMP